MVERAVLVEDHEDVLHLLPEHGDVLRRPVRIGPARIGVSDEKRRNIGARIGLRRHQRHGGRESGLNEADGRKDSRAAKHSIHRSLFCPRSEDSSEDRRLVARDLGIRQEFGSPDDGWMTEPPRRRARETPSSFAKQRKLTTSSGDQANQNQTGRAENGAHNEDRPIAEGLGQAADAESGEDRAQLSGV